MTIIYKNVEDLIPYINNTRTHSKEQVNQIASSIKEFGFTNPVLVDEQGGIIAGHGRIMGAKLLKMDEVPTICLDGLSEAQKKAYIIADNKIALNAGWNEELLKLELQDLKDMNFDLSLIGFSDEELSEFDIEADYTMSIDKEREDDIPEISDEYSIKLGDIVEFDGGHRLMCGDSTNEKDVFKLMNNNIAQMVFTDPPYNVAIQGKAGSIKNDDMEDTQFYNFLLSVYRNYNKFMKDGAVIYVAHADSERINFTKAFIDADFKFAQNLIWNKHSATLSRQDYNWKHEPILYGWKKGAGHYFCKDFTKTTVIEDKIDYSKMKKEELIAEIRHIKQSFTSSVIDYDRPTVSDLHPTMKPVGLVQGFVENSSEPKWIVLDLFGGAGSTFIACINSGRVSYNMELDEKYAQVIIQRYVDYTSNPKIKINGVEVDWEDYKASAKND